MRGRIHEHENVERISVVAQRRGNEAKIERKHHAFRQKAAQHEQIRVGIVIELVAAAFGCFDDGAARAFLGIELMREWSDRTYCRASERIHWRERRS